MDTTVNVGDRVVLLNDGGYGSQGVEAGDKGTITNVLSFGNFVQVEVEGINFWLMMFASDTEVEPEEPEEPEDTIAKPKHYARWAIEPVTLIMRNGFEFWRGNIIKYASRAGFKLYPGMDEVESEITDLRKVIRYSEMRINQLEGEMVL